jgi:DNA-binding transcriptional LysR family regulator
MFFSRQIHQFITIARAGSFSRAATEIAVTPSALSHGIHELEQRLGKKLLVRKKSGVFLTRYGNALYNDIAPLYDKVVYILTRTKNEVPKTVICVDGLLNPTFPKKLDNLFKQFGNNIQITSSNAASVLDDILDEKYDILLDVSFGLKENIPDNIYKIALAPERLGVLASSRILKKYKDPVDMLKNESIFQRNSALLHNVFKQVKQHMSGHFINVNFIGLPDLADVIGALSLDMRICLASNNVLRHPAFIDHDFNFVELPKNMEFIMNRGLYFKKERYEELIDVLSCIQNE